MNDDIFASFDKGQLSEESLKVLREFEAMQWDTADVPANEVSAQEVAASGQTAEVDEDVDDMLLLFVTEVDEDLTMMLTTLQHLEHEQELTPLHFHPLQRAGHKIRGSAGFMACEALSAMAHHVEEFAREVVEGKRTPASGLRVLRPAILGLQQILEGIVDEGEERAAVLQEYEASLPALESENQSEEVTSASSPQEAPVAQVDASPDVIPVDDGQHSWLRVESSRVAQLVQDSRQLSELQSTLQSARAQTRIALQDFHRTQSNLRKLLSQFCTLLYTPRPVPPSSVHSPSSLVTRILNESIQHTNQQPRQSRTRVRTNQHGGQATAVNASLWDELEMERYTEKDLLLHAFQEAMAEATHAETKVQEAFARLEQVLHTYTAQTDVVHEDALHIRLAPLRVLYTRLQTLVEQHTSSKRRITISTSGEQIEIDREILESLVPALIALVQASLLEANPTDVLRIWLTAQQINHETILLEVGFSTAIGGGFFEMLREPVRRVDGQVSLVHNEQGGISFLLRLPQMPGGVHCLQVRVGTEELLVPISQVHHVGDNQYDEVDVLHHLGELLNLPSKQQEARLQPIIVLPQEESAPRIGVMVDEVIDEVRLMVKFLDSYLRRPGITRAAVDGNGRVLLLLDLPEVIRSYTLRKKAEQADEDYRRQEQKTILIADDSVSLRQSLSKLLYHEHYRVLEARDGVEALDMLLRHIPDVLLLDIEMPNLNGYGVLQEMTSHPQLAHVKTVMLTSRSSEKHTQQAWDLGVQDYLTKPCTQEELLTVLHNQLDKKPV